MEDKTLGLLGLMRRAGAIQIGEDNTADAVHAGKAKLLLLASDAPEKARRRAEGYVFGHRTQTVPLHYTGEELAGALGTGGCAMAAVTDIGFANALMKGLSQQYPDRYSAIMAETDKRCAKAARRKKETEEQRKAKRNVKRRTEA